MLTTRIRTIAGTSLLAAALGLVALGAAAPATADNGCVNYAGINACWDD